MRINLQLAGWPPIASHITSLLFGVSLAHLSWRDGPMPLQLPPRAVILSLSPALMKATGAGGLQRGMRVHLLHSPGGLPTCRLSNEPFAMLETAPAPIVSAGMNALAEVSASVQAALDGELTLRAAASALSLPRCTAKPKVTYGGA